MRMCYISNVTDDQITMDAWRRLRSRVTVRWARMIGLPFGFQKTD